MIDRVEGKAEMQGNNEASIGGLKVAQEYSYDKVTCADGHVELSDNDDQHSVNAISNEKVNWESSSLNHSFSRPYYRRNISTWPYVYSEYQFQAHPYTRDGYCHMNREHSLPMENRIQYIPFKLVSRGYPHDSPLQDFQYFVVIDFEATCDKDKSPNPQEIIEFPSVLVNSATGQLEASFQTYVRPMYHQHLTDFCKELTGIQQIQVDRGVPLSEALHMHDKWLEDKGIKHKNFAIVTWSNWDCHVMLESECRFKRIRKPPYFNRWINLKVPFHEVFGSVRCNLKEAVQLAGLAWEGRAHCGLDDARNTARLLSVLMRRGFKFSITNSLMWHSATQTVTQPLSDRAADPNHQVAKLKESFASPIQMHHALMGPLGKDRSRSMYFCFCGVLSSRCIVRKPGPTQGRCFYGCGNWTATRRAACSYFKWE